MQCSASLSDQHLLGHYDAFSMVGDLVLSQHAPDTVIIISVIDFCIIGILWVSFLDTVQCSKSKADCLFDLEGIYSCHND